MITLKKIREQVKKVSNEYSINAQIVADSNTNLTDIFGLRIIDFINISLNKIYREYLVSATKEYSLFPIESVTGKTGFDLIQHLNEDIKIYFNCIKSLYFEADNVGTVEFNITKDGVKTTETITLDGEKNVFKAYRKQLDCDYVEVIFKGEYPYGIRNIGAYLVKFASIEDIPAYTPLISLNAPNDLLQLDTIKLQDMYGDMIELPEYESLNDKIMIPYETKGNLICSYYKTPAKVPDDANESYEIEISDSAIDCLCYMVASLCMQGYDDEKATFLYNKGELALASLSRFTSNIESTKRIANVRGW